MTDKTGSGGMDRMGDQVLLDELGVIGDKGRLIRDKRRGKISLDILDTSLHGDDMILQEAGNIFGNRLVNNAQSRFRRFRNGKDPVEILESRACCLRGFLAYQPCSIR